MGLSHSQAKQSSDEDTTPQAIDLHRREIYSSITSIQSFITAPESQPEAMSAPPNARPGANAQPDAGQPSQRNAKKNKRKSRTLGVPKAEVKVSRRAKEENPAVADRDDRSDPADDKTLSQDHDKVCDLLTQTQTDSSETRISSHGKLQQENQTESQRKQPNREPKQLPPSKQPQADVSDALNPSQAANAKSRDTRDGTFKTKKSQEDRRQAEELNQSEGTTTEKGVQSEAYETKSKFLLLCCKSLWYGETPEYSAHIKSKGIEQHAKIFPPKEKPKCCGLDFLKVAQFRKHMRENHSKQMHVWQQNVQTFMICKQAMARGKMSQEDVQILDRPVECCGFKFRNVFHLEIHLDNCHRMPDWYHRAEKVQAMMQCRESFERYLALVRNALPDDQQFAMSTYKLAEQHFLAATNSMIYSWNKGASLEDRRAFHEHLGDWRREEADLWGPAWTAAGVPQRPRSENSNRRSTMPDRLHSPPSLDEQNDRGRSPAGGRGQFVSGPRIATPAQAERFSVLDEEPQSRAQTGKKHIDPENGKGSPVPSTPYASSGPGSVEEFPDFEHDSSPMQLRRPQRVSSNKPVQLASGPIVPEFPGAFVNQIPASINDSTINGQGHGGKDSPGIDRSEGEGRRGKSGGGSGKNGFWTGSNAAERPPPEFRETESQQYRPQRGTHLSHEGGSTRGGYSGPNTPQSYKSPPAATYAFSPGGGKHSFEPARSFPGGPQVFEPQRVRPSPLQSPIQQRHQATHVQNESHYAEQTRCRAPFVQSEYASQTSPVIVDRFAHFSPGYYGSRKTLGHNNTVPAWSGFSAQATEFVPRSQVAVSGHDDAMASSEHSFETNPPEIRNDPGTPW